MLEVINGFRLAKFWSFSKKGGFYVNNNNVWRGKTFIISFAISVLFVLWGIFGTESLGNTADSALAFFTDNFGWSFLLGVSIFVLASIFLMVSSLGKIRLGGDNEEPEYSTFSWFAMLFSAGMGIGLLFWGVSEPIWHYIWPPFGEAGTLEAANYAIRYSFFHWGLHPWAIYVVVGASLAYFSYRKKMPMLISSTLYPVLGADGINGGMGRLVNILAVFATLFGLGTSLGLGAMQIGNGLEQLFGIENTQNLGVLVIIVVTIAAIISTITGIKRGIKTLSQINIIVALGLMGLVFVLGPTLFILRTLTTGIGDYFANILDMSFFADPHGGGGWINAWTIFYWAWWLAWAPFVGTFIARISKGRTLRQFVMGAMLVPVAVSFIWFSVFGGAALHVEIYGDGGIASAVEQAAEAGFFTALLQYPLSQLLILIATFSVIIFFITSSDSGTYVNGMLTAGGDPNPPVALRVVWGATEGAIAAILLFTGGLAALQTASIVAGFPFMVIMFFMAYSLFKAIKLDAQNIDLDEALEAEGKTVDL